LGFLRRLRVEVVVSSVERKEQKKKRERERERERRAINRYKGSNISVYSINR